MLCDFVFVSATWLNESICDAELLGPCGFYTFMWDRKNRDILNTLIDKSGIGPDDIAH